MSTLVHVYHKCRLYSDVSLFSSCVRRLHCDRSNNENHSKEYDDPHDDITAPRLTRLNSDNLNRNQPGTSLN